MLRSMTGFGAAAGVVDEVEYSVEIKSVNNRYLKIQQRLPDGLSAMEPEIEKRLRAEITRGSVVISVRMKVSQAQAACQVNTDLLSQYLQQLRLAEADADPNLRIDLAGLLQLPGVCQPPSMDELAEKTSADLLGLVADALAGLGQMRQTEGQAIAEDLTACVAEIETSLAAVTELAKDMVQTYHDKLQLRVNELLARAQIKIDEESLAREVAIFADRSDINEELSRLGQHIAEFRKLLNADEPVGRKLDFIAQEMLREANTIGSKGAHAEIGRCVVNMKTAIDRIKEQAANVE